MTFIITYSKKSWASASRNNNFNGDMKLDMGENPLCILHCC